MSDINQWHYLDNAGQQAGPVTADDLQQLATTGEIHPETSVWTEGLEEWIPASQVEGLILDATPPQSTQSPQPASPQINLGPGTGIH